jgi:hypothetical protein
MLCNTQGLYCENGMSAENFSLKQSFPTSFVEPSLCTGGCMSLTFGCGTLEISIQSFIRLAPNVEPDVVMCANSDSVKL